MSGPVDPNDAMRAQVAALHAALLGDLTDPTRPGILRRLERLEQVAMWAVRGIVGVCSAAGAILVAAVVHFFSLNK